MHEIGIALGASGGRLLSILVSRGMVLGGIGSALGIAGALEVTRGVQGMLLGIRPTNPGTFAGVTAFFLLIALGACLLPTFRAMQVDPLEALRKE